jgi:glycosyltransferase 2 family protein
MSKPAVKTVLIAVKIVVSTALLAYLFSGANVGEMAAQVRQMNLLWTTAALGTYAGMLAVSAWRWRLLLQIQTVDVSMATLTRSFLVATFFNNFLPSNIGGDVVRVADTARFAGSKTLATTVVLLDRILGLLALLAVAAAASGLATFAGLPLTGTGYIWIALIVLAVGLTWTLARPGLFSRPLSALLAGRAQGIQTRFNNLIAAVERFSKEPRTLLSAFAGAIAVQALLVLFYVFVARSLAVPLPLLAASVIVPVSFVVQMMPVSINGFGVREAVFTFFFRSLGLSVGSALTLSLGSAALIMFFSLSGGIVFALRYRSRSEPAAELL